MNAQVTPVRHKDVYGTEKYYLKVANDKGTEAIFTVGQGALEIVEELLKAGTVKTTDQKPTTEPKTKG